MILDGIYITNRNLAVKIREELSQGSKIQMNQSIYVVHDESLSPTVIAEATKHIHV